MRRALLLGALCWAAAPSGAVARGPIPARYSLATVLTPHAVHARPSATAPRTRALLPYGPITGGRTVVPVTGAATGRGGVRWLRVLLPGRPNGARGWITATGTETATTRWHLVVHTASRRVAVYREHRRVRVLGAVVGKPATPTPHGRFFVEESVVMRPGAPGGPFALALSARSDVLQEFEGGPGQIALHGIDNLGGTIGAAQSHGCVRLTGRGIRWLVARITPGVRVDITH